MKSYKYKDMKSVRRFDKFFKFITLIIAFLVINQVNFKVYGNYHNTKAITSDDFNDVLNKNNASYHEYENAEELFNDFFGLNDPRYEIIYKTNYQDLSLQIDSKNLRDLYKQKLNEMKNSNSSYKQDNWSFFKKKI